MSDAFGACCAMILLWLVVGVFPGYLFGTEDAFDGNNKLWTCTRWENKPDGDCTQWTRKEPSR